MFLPNNLLSSFICEFYLKVKAWLFYLIVQDNFNYIIIKLRWLKDFNNY